MAEKAETKEGGGKSNKMKMGDGGRSSSSDEKWNNEEEVK